MARSQLPTCSTFQWVTADWWNGPWDEELDEMDTTEEGVEFIMTPLLLLRTTPLLLPSGVTTALVGLDNRELLARPAPVTEGAEWIEHVGLVRRRDGSLLFGCPEALAVECSLKNSLSARNCFNCSLTCCCGRERGA